MGVDSGEDQELPVKALAFLLLSCQHSFASGLLLLPDAVPALGIAFLVFPPRLVSPFPGQDLVVLFLDPRINLRLQLDLGLRPIRHRLHKHPRAARPLHLLEELRERLVLRLRRRPQAHHHPIGQRQRDYHYQRRAKHPRQFLRLLFHAQYYTKNSVHPTTGIILRQSTLETGTSAQARRTKKKTSGTSNSWARRESDWAGTNTIFPNIITGKTSRQMRRARPRMKFATLNESGTGREW